MGIKNEVFKQESFLFRRELINPPETLIRVRGNLFSRLNQKLKITDQKEIIIERYKRNLDLILMNLFLANRRGIPLRYGRSTAFFIRDNCGESNRPYIRYKMSREIFDFLESQGYIQQFIGFHKAEDYDEGKLTRVVINNSMVKLLSSIEMFTIFESDTRMRNSIIVRSKSKFNSNIDLRYKGILKNFWMLKDEIKLMKKNLDQLNKLYDRSKITVQIPTHILNEKLTGKLDELLTHNIPITHLKINDKINGIDINNNYINIIDNIYYNRNVFSGKNDVSPSNYWKKMPGVTQIDLEIKFKHIRRIFRDNLKSNGRFHGPIYQQMNKKFREYILIDGEETVELDYEAMHVRMLYHAIGIDYKDDPFDMPSKESRYFVKKLGLMMLNSKSKRAAILAIVFGFAKEGINITRITAKDILDKFCKRHEPISKFFYNSRWRSLFLAESDIIYGILMELKKKSIVGLPIHDSIIVKKKHEELLRSLMIEKYKDVFKFAPLIS